MTTPTGSTSRRGYRGRAALAVIAAALGIFGLASATWFSASVPGAVQGSVEVASSGADAVPALGGVALVLLAAGAALGLVGPSGRRVVGALVALAGAVGGVLAVQVLRAPGEALRDAVAATTGVGHVPAQVATSPVAWLTVALAVGVVVLGAWHTAGRGAWPTPGARHERPTDPGTASGTASPLDDPARTWDALSDGTDPT